MDDSELNEIKQGFLEEASQLLSDAEHCFLGLENDPQNPELINQIFRLAHNLKGRAKAVGFEDMGEFTHKLESLLLKVKSGEISIGTDLVNLLLLCNDHLQMMVEKLKASLGARFDSSELMARMDGYLNGEAPAAASTPAQASEEVAPVPADLAPGEVATADLAVVADVAFSATDAASAVSGSELNAILEAASQIEIVPGAAPVPAAAPANVATPAPAPVANQKASQTVSADESIRVSLGRLEGLINYVGELVILQTVLKQQVYQNNPLLLRKTVNQLGKVTKEIQDLSLGLRMVPVKQTFQKMQRIVRDTATALGKKVQLMISGEETELDKTVLEHLGDPLVHLIRNAVDHGIESADARASTGKPAMGTIHLSAYHKGGSLVIEIRDDGGGIDGEKLKAKAREKGIIKPGANLSEKDSIHLIFHPGFSTKSVVTDVSGRGVGLDVVKTNVEKLQGSVHVETHVGKGTLFQIRLPLTLAIIDGMITALGEERYVFPLAQVHESLKPDPADVHSKSNLGQILVLRGEPLPLFRLETLLNKKPTTEKPLWESIAIVVRSSAQPFAILVDDIVGQHQVVIKNLGSELKGMKGISGSAILGDGRPALILEPSELVNRHTPRPQPMVRSATA